MSLAAVLLWRSRKALTNQFFSFVLICISIWAGSIMMFRASLDSSLLSFWLNAYYFAAALIALAFFLFSNIFPYSSQQMRLKNLFVHLLLLVALFVIVGQFGVVRSIMPNQAGDHVAVLNLPVYTVYVMYFIGYIVSAFTILLLKIRASSGHIRVQLRIVVGATMIAAASGILFDLLLPLYTYQHIAFGPYMTAVMVSIIARYVFFAPSRA